MNVTSAQLADIAEGLWSLVRAAQSQVQAIGAAVDQPKRQLIGWGQLWNGPRPASIESAVAGYLDSLAPTSGAAEAGVAAIEQLARMAETCSGELANAEALLHDVDSLPIDDVAGRLRRQDAASSRIASANEAWLQAQRFLSNDAAGPIAALRAAVDLRIIGLPEGAEHYLGGGAFGFARPGLLGLAAYSLSSQGEDDEESDADAALRVIGANFDELDVDGNGQLTLREIEEGANSDDEAIADACQYLLGNPLVFTNAALAEQSYSVGSVDDVGYDDVEVVLGEDVISPDEDDWSVSADTLPLPWQYLVLTPGSISLAISQNRHGRVLGQPAVFVEADAADGDADGQVSLDGLEQLGQNTEDPAVLAMTEFYLANPRSFERFDRETPGTGHDDYVRYDQVHELNQNQGALAGLPDPDDPSGIARPLRRVSRLRRCRNPVLPFTYRTTAWPGPKSSSPSTSPTRRFSVSRPVMAAALTRPHTPVRRACGSSWTTRLES